jgi:pyruvate/2-oxoglutarate dehydrogenase complex dihydrolipoamide dehydrogenase (E3) component
VRLNTAATPEDIQKEGFDVVLVAVGSKPNQLNIPGADGANVHPPLSVYGNHESVGENVVVVGGSETGTETGLYLAMNGHKVTVLTRQKVLAPEAAQVHYVEMLHNACKREPNFSYIPQASTTKIEPDGVTYRDADGQEHKLLCDDVILSAGVHPCTDDGMKFYGSAERFYLVGDCQSAGSIQTCMRSAFATASQI